MSIVAKKRRRWARKLERVQERRRIVGLPPLADPERFLFDCEKRLRKPLLPRRVYVEPGGWMP